MKMSPKWKNIEEISTGDSEATEEIMKMLLQGIYP